LVVAVMRPTIFDVLDRQRVNEPPDDDDDDDDDTANALADDDEQYGTVSSHLAHCVANLNQTSNFTTLLSLARSRTRSMSGGVQGALVGTSLDALRAEQRRLDAFLRTSFAGTTTGRRSLFNDDDDDDDDDDDFIFSFAKIVATTALLNKQSKSSKSSASKAPSTTSSSAATKSEIDRQLEFLRHIASA
jgi:hypothetical protein